MARRRLWAGVCVALRSVQNRMRHYGERVGVTLRYALNAAVSRSAGY